MAHRVIRPQRCKAAVHEHELRAPALGASKRDVDVRDLAGSEVRPAPVEREPPMRGGIAGGRRLPGGDPPGLVDRGSRWTLVLLEQPAADLAFEHERTRLAP